MDGPSGLLTNLPSRKPELFSHYNPEFSRKVCSGLVLLASPQHYCSLAAPCAAPPALTHWHAAHAAALLLLSTRAHEHLHASCRYRCA